MFCTAKGCNNKATSKGFCNMHFLRLYRYGRLERVNKKWPSEIGKDYGNKSIGWMHAVRFGGMREVIIQRDSERCVSCGMTREIHKKTFGRDLTVNHKDKNGRHSNIQNNQLENLETLCLRCHGSKDATQHGRYAIYGRERTVI